MTEWEIVRIDEDPGGTPDHDRWLVTYRVPAEYSPDGTFSYSFPKDSMNKFAALYEYDVNDAAQVDELFDYIMSRPMLKARPVGARAATGHPQRVAPEAATHVQSLSDAVNTARLAAHPTHALRTPPSQLRAALKAGIQAMKDGEAPLVARDKVHLRIAGMPEQSDGVENPKYIIKRDLVARLDPELMDRHREYFRRERRNAEAARRGVR
jgi:hypothetical protein